MAQALLIRNNEQPTLRPLSASHVTGTATKNKIKTFYLTFCARPSKDLKLSRLEPEKQTETPKVVPRETTNKISKNTTVFPDLYCHKHHF